MNVEKDDLELRLDLQLGDEFRGQLDQQLGRAVPYFLEHRVTGADRRITPRWRRGARLGLAALAAACCAGLLVWQQTRSAEVAVQPKKKAGLVSAPDANRATGPVANDAPGIEHQPVSAPSVDDAERVAESNANSDPGQPLVLARAVSSRTLDEGTLLVGRTPVRKVRRQWLERVEWFDAENGARVQRIVPREEILFVPLPIN